MPLVRNGEKCKMKRLNGMREVWNRKILLPRVLVKYIMVILENWDRTHVQEGWQNTVYYMEQEVYLTRLDWVEDSNQSDWNFCRTLKTVYSRSNTMLFWMKTVLKEHHV